MAKIEKLKKGTATIYPATIPQAVVDPTSGKSAREELDEKANHGYTAEPKTLKQVDDEVIQLAGEVSVKIKNLAVNGDFANGTTGWRPASGTSISVTAEGTLKVNVTVTFSTAGALTTVDGDGLKYARARFKPSVNVSLVRIGDSSTPVNILANVWSTISELSNESSSFRFYMGLPSGENYELDDVVIVDLTETFGAGNEPTKSEMDLLIGILGVDYFDGEITIPAQKVMQWQLKMIRQNRNAIVALGGTII